jgi:3-oxoadipate enol-lactonase
MRKSKELFIEIDGLKTYYVDLGTGFIPIIFIHGFPFDKSTWRPQMQFFKKTHRVIAYDIRGFGKSDSGAEKDSIIMYAEDLLKFMDALHIEKAIVCGLSMGGYILLNAVHISPSRFDAIILADTKCEADTELVKAKRLKTVEDIKANGLYGFLNGFLKSVFCEKTFKENKNMVENVEETMFSSSQATISKALVAMAERTEMCSTLIDINIPTLIICGKEDSITPVKQSKFLQQNIKKSSLHIIENAGHLSNIEQSSKFNKLVQHFLENKPHLVPTPLYGNEIISIPRLFEK